MSLPSVSVNRPVFTTMVTLIVVVLGLVSLDRVRIDLLPEVETPTISVRTTYDGASPEVMERLVTQIIEEIVGTVPGVEEITSESGEGSSSVRVRFQWGTDVDVAASEVRARIEGELDELPDNTGRPRISSFDVNSFPVVVLGVSSELNPVDLTTVIEDQIRYRFARIAGVAQVDPWGSYLREVRIEIDPGRLRALGLPLNEILDAVRDANLDLPAGEIEAGRYEVTLRAPAEFESVEQIEQTVIAVRGGAPVTLGQIATVLDTHERLRRHVRVNGNLGIRLAIRKQADANTVEVSQAVLEEIERCNADFPQVRIFPIINQGNFIERSIANVASSVLYGGGLAILVLLFFLRNIRSTTVIALAIPICVIATFSLIYFGGFTLNLMTLGGLALGVGMMVDNSIVVLENVFRRTREDGVSPREGAVAGAIEVAPAIVASTITTLVIFLPVVFIRGVSGVLFRELAYVIVFSLVCSLVVSLSLVPMLSSKILKPRAERRGLFGSIKNASDRAFEAVDNGYRDLLRWVLRNRVLTLLSTGLVVFGTAMLFPRLGQEFLPPSDEGEVRITGEMEVGTRLEIVDRQTRLMERIVVENVPEKLAWVTSVGASSYNPEDGATGEIRLALVPAAERDRSNVEIASDLRTKLEGRIPGMTVRTRAPQGQWLLQRLLGGDEGITVEVRGFDLETLRLLTKRAAQALAQVPGITDVNSNSDPGTPQEELAIDRAKAADLGVSVRDIAETIETAIGGREAGEFRSAGNSYRILVRLRDAERMTIDEVLDLTVRSRTGESVALRNLVRSDESRGPTLIRRVDQQRTFEVRADYAGRDLGDVAADAEAALAGIARPTGYEILLAGNVEEQRRSQRELLISLALALVLVFMVLACQYESLRDPLIVMLSVPLAGVGVILALFLT
ncbi:MAG: efflux RND transporter permease subunit, partial [Planctomycetota bacterium]